MNDADGLLIVVAHPDDECFPAAATAARYRDEGRMVSLATLTAGGAGLWSGRDPDDIRPLTQVRRAELTCAASLLGIEPVFVLDYPDAALDRFVFGNVKDKVLSAVKAFAPRRDSPNGYYVAAGDRLVHDVVRVIRSVRPRVVLTFGADGLMGKHTDHRATHAVVRRAWRALVGDAAAPQKLYYLTAQKATEGRNNFPPITTHVYVRGYQERKRAAFRCYVSQQHERGRLEHFIAKQGDWEVFSLAEGQVGPKDKDGLEADLFA